jgi:hypothetical protein
MAGSNFLIRHIFSTRLQKYVLEAQNSNHLMPFFTLDFPQKWNLLALCIEQVHRSHRVSEDRSERVTWRKENVTAMRQDDSICLHHAMDAGISSLHSNSLLL